MSFYEVLSLYFSKLKIAEPNVSLWPFTLFMGIAFLLITIAFLYRIAQIKAESMARIREMAETIEDLIKDHEEELDIERRKISAHCIKLKMQKRDCLTKVGSLQRKLRENQATMKGLNSKLASLEWAEEDADDLVDQLMDAREKLRENESKIKSLQYQLQQYQSKEQTVETVSDCPILMKLLQSDEENKENDNQNNTTVI